MTTNAECIIVATIKHDVAAAATTSDKLRVAMKSARAAWITTDENTQFRAAVAAVLLLTEGEDRERIEQECEAIAALNAALSGVPVNFAGVVNMMPQNPFGLMKLWLESQP